MAGERHFSRRDFLSAFPFTGYSVVVLADRLPAAPYQPDWIGQIQGRFDGLSPRGVPRGGLPAEPNMTVVGLETDFLVAGGGLAGVCAAIAAARHGARVILVQDRSRLGGNSSSEVRMHVLGADRRHKGWREGGILEELRLADAAHNPQRS